MPSLGNVHVACSKQYRRPTEQSEEAQQQILVNKYTPDRDKRERYKYSVQEATSASGQRREAVSPQLSRIGNHPARAGSTTQPRSVAMRH